MRRLAYTTSRRAQYVATEAVCLLLDPISFHFAAPSLSPTLFCVILHLQKDTEMLMRIGQDSSWHRFVVMRHPWDRLVSAYRNKVLVR
jgi:hypothetical protein